MVPNQEIHIMFRPCKRPRRFAKMPELAGWMLQLSKVLLGKRLKLFVLKWEQEKASHLLKENSSTDCFASALTTLSPLWVHHLNIDPVFEVWTYFSRASNGWRMDLNNPVVCGFKHAAETGMMQTPEHRREKKQKKQADHRKCNKDV